MVKIKANEIGKDERGFLQKKSSKYEHYASVCEWAAYCKLPQP